jgi:GT2 family glycosyltransferase
VARPLWLAALVEALETSSEDIAAVASLMLSLDDPDVVDNAGDNLSWTGAAEKIGHGQPASEFRKRKEIFSPSGAATLYRREFLETLGGFDEKFFAYLEDVDLGLRGRQLGNRYLMEPRAEILHKGYGSAIRRQDYVRLVTKNRLMVFVKSVPWVLMLKHLHRLVYGQLYFFIAYRRPWHSLAGYMSFVANLLHVLRERKKMNRLRRISISDLDGLLSKTMSEPPLRYLLARKIGRRRT